MKTILIIENISDILENLTEAFEMEGYKVLAADNGMKGIEIAREFIPDIIVSGILIGEVDGYEVLRTLSNEFKTYRIPFIFSTTKSQDRDKALAFELGADDYIVKPYELADLFAKVNRCLTMRNERVKDNVIFALMRANVGNLSLGI